MFPHFQVARPLPSMISAQTTKTSRLHSSRERRPQSEVVLSPKNFPYNLEPLDYHPEMGRQVHYSNSSPDIAHQVAAESTCTSKIFVPSAISEEDEATEENKTRGTDTVDGSDCAIKQSKSSPNMKNESGKEATPGFEICPTVEGLL